MFVEALKVKLLSSKERRSIPASCSQYRLRDDKTIKIKKNLPTNKT